MSGTGLLTDCDKIVLRRKRRLVPTKPHREKKKEKETNKQKNNAHNLFSMLMEEMLIYEHFGNEAGWWQWCRSRTWVGGEQRRHRLRSRRTSGLWRAKRVVWRLFVKADSSHVIDTHKARQRKTPVLGLCLSCQISLTCSEHPLVFPQHPRQGEALCTYHHCLQLVFSSI